MLQAVTTNALGGLDERAQNEAQYEAQCKLKEKCPSWTFPEGFAKMDAKGTPLCYSTFTVTADGGPMNIVLKSRRAEDAPFFINAKEWNWLVGEEKAKLFLYTRTSGGALDVVESFADELILEQPEVSLSFSTENLDIDEYRDRVSAFSKTLQYFKDLRFRFEHFHISEATRERSVQEELYTVNSRRQEPTDSI